VANGANHRRLQVDMAIDRRICPLARTRILRFAGASTPARRAPPHVFCTRMFLPAAASICAPLMTGARVARNNVENENVGSRRRGSGGAKMAAMVKA